MLNIQQQLQADNNSKNRMGNNCTTSYPNSQKNWSIFNKQKNTYILKNAHLSVEVQKHTAYFKYNKTSNDENIYQWRKANKGQSNIVEVYYCKISNDQKLDDFCNGIEEREVNVFTQIIKPIHQQQNITSYLGLQLLSDWVNGAITLKDKFGFFRIKKKMVGINTRKIGKMWINSNYAKNEIQLKKCSNEHNVDDSIMVKDLCTIVNKKISFAKQLYGKKLNQARQHINILKKANRSLSLMQMENQKEEKEENNKKDIKKIKLSENYSKRGTNQTKNITVDDNQNSNARKSALYVKYHQKQEVIHQNSGYKHSFQDQSTLNTTNYSCKPSTTNYLSPSNKNTDKMVSSNNVDVNKKNHINIYYPRLSNIYYNNMFLNSNKNRNSSIYVNEQKIKKPFTNDVSPSFNINKVQSNNHISSRINNFPSTFRKITDQKRQKDTNIFQTYQEKSNQIIPLINSMTILDKYQPIESEQFLIEQSVIIRGMDEKI